MRQHPASCSRPRTAITTRLFATVAIAIAGAWSTSATADVRINEFMASNRTTVADEDGDHPDWIELHNSGPEAVDLGGWGLSDNDSNPFKWTFAPGTIIAPGGYLLVWASGKDRPGTITEGTPPDEIDGLVSWLRADNTGLDDGQPVPLLIDASGNGNHATQPNSGQRPTVQHALLNGLPALDFDRSASQQLFLPTADFQGLDDFTNFTFIAVARWTGGVRSGLFGGFRGSNLANIGSSVFEIPNTGGALRLRLPPSINLEVPNTVTLNQWHLLGASMDSGGGGARMFRDGEILAGSEAAVGRTLLADYERLPVGSSHDDGRTFGGQIAEMLIYNRGLTGAERNSLERHLALKYDLPLELDKLWPHTNYSIAATGEPLSLTRPDGTLADHVGPVDLPPDVSFGRSRDDPDLWTMLQVATPGAFNDSDPLPDPLEPVQWSHDAGFYNASFSLQLGHPDPGAVIIYTLDGSEPDIENLTGTTYQVRNSYNNGPLLPMHYESVLYNGPIAITDRSSEPNKISLVSSTSGSNAGYLPVDPIKKATVVRARAYLDGAMSPVSTATFFVSDEQAFDYSLPIVSLAFNEDGFFDYHDGIYVAGVDHVTNSGGRICNWGNFNRRGREAERPGHFQFFDQQQLAVDHGVGLRIHGNCSRRNAFKSLRLHMRRDYDLRGPIVHPFFNETIPGAIQPDPHEFDRLILRAPNINELSFSRLFQPVYEGTGGRLRPAIQFLNGEYWGICMVRDRLDERYLARHFDLDEDNVVMINIKYGHEVGTNNLREFDVDAGVPEDMEDFQAMRAFIIGNHMADAQLYAQAQELLDIDSFIDHLILKIFAGDDHYAPEYVFWKVREPEGPGFGDGRWRVIVKDFDSTLNTNNYVTELAEGTHVRGFGHEVFTSLLDNQEFRHAFINRFADLLNSHFLTGRFQQVIHQAFDEMAPYWPEVNARWPNTNVSNPNRPFTTTHRNNLLNWASQHPGRQRTHLRQHFNIAANRNLTVDVSSPQHGRVRVNTIAISADTPGIDADPYPWNGVYFHDVPVTLTAEPEPGQMLAGWQLDGAGDFVSTSPQLTLTMTSDTGVTAVFQDAPVIHRWTFDEAETLLEPDITTGGAALSIEPGPDTEVEFNNSAQGFDSPHLRVNNPLGATLLFTVPTTGFGAFTLSYDTRRSGQGAGRQRIEYTTDGSQWTQLAEYDVFNDDPQPRLFDFSQIEQAWDNDQFAVRITFDEQGGGSAGNHRFDNFTLAGTALPGTNAPPAPTGAAPVRIDLVEDAAEQLVDPSSWFEDPDDDPLTFTASAAALQGEAQAAAASAQAGQISLTGLQRGESVLTVTADDGHNPPVETTVRLLVHPAAHALADGPYNFGHWDPDSPAGAYPSHMLFVQGEENDSTLATLLDHAYHIPPDDEAASGDNLFPYRASTRTRINGLGDEGVAFINTGRGRDLGGALLALDTSGVDQARVAFTGGTVATNNRIYALRLQYRLGTDGPFTDVTDGEGDPVEYVRGPESGHSEVLGPVDLPPALLDQPYVQLLWRYHLVSGTSGPRAQLRLGDVLVSAEQGGEPAALAFDPLPTGVQSGAGLPPVVVRVLDEAGLPVTDYNGPVTIALGAGSDGELLGTLTVDAVDGVAVFDDLVVNGVGAIDLEASIDGLPVAAGGLQVLTLTELLMPVHIQGDQDEINDNNDRVPFAWLARIDGLAPESTYRYGNRMVAPGDAVDNDGAGNMIFITGAGPDDDWIRTTSSPRFLENDLGTRHHTFTTDAAGSFTGWFITEPSGNARFTPGNTLRPRLLLNDGAGGTETALILTSAQEAVVLPFGDQPGHGTGVIGAGSPGARVIAVLHDDPAGAGRPLAATPVEITGAGTDDRYAAFYDTIVATSQGRWGSILPNTLPQGLRRIEYRSAIDGSLIDQRVEPAGFAGTIDPGGGLTPILLDVDDQQAVFLPGGSAAWHVPFHWSTGGVPEEPGDTALINAPTIGDRTIDVDEATVVGGLRFVQGDTPFRNRLRSAGDGGLRFDGAGQPAVIIVEGDDEAAGHVDFDLASGVHLDTDLVLQVHPYGGDPQQGALRLQRDWTGTGGLIKQGHGLASLTGGVKDFTGALVIEQGVLRVTGPAVPAETAGVTVLPGGQLRLVSGGSVEQPRVHHFGGGTISLAGMGRSQDLPEGEQLGILGALRYDPVDNDNLATLVNDVQLTAPTDIHVDGTRNTLVLEGAVHGPFDLIKTGGGILALAADSPGYSGTLQVINGPLRIDADLSGSPVALADDGVLSGSGSVGAITGDGSVVTGGDTLTAANSSAARLQFVLSNPDGQPDGNGMLHLTGPDPLPVAPGRIDLFIDADQLQPLDRFAGGVRVGPGIDLAAALAASDVRVFLADEDGGVEHLGQTYRQAGAGDGLTWIAVGLPGGQGRVLEVRSADLPTGYQLWRLEAFPDPGDFDDDDVSGPDASPDGLVPNLVRYALDLGPQEPAASWLPRLTEGGDDPPQLRFRFDSGKDDLAWIVRGSHDMIDWPLVLFDSRNDPPPDAAGDGWFLVPDPDDDEQDRLFLMLELLLLEP